MKKLRHCHPMYMVAWWYENGSFSVFSVQLVYLRKK